MTHEFLRSAQILRGESCEVAQ